MQNLARLSYSALYVDYYLRMYYFDVLVRLPSLVLTQYLNHIVYRVEVTVLLAVVDLNHADLVMLVGLA